MLFTNFFISFGKSYGIFERALPYALSLAREDYVCWSPYTLQKAASGLVNIAFIDIDVCRLISCVSLSAGYCNVQPCQAGP